MSQLLQQDRYIIREKFWKFFGNSTAHRHH